MTVPGDSFGMPRESKPLVVCLVGTDHHPFDRLVGWCDTLAADHSELEVLVQHGRSTPSNVARTKDFLGKAELAATLARARCAITHGGPGLISEVRAAGLLPIAVSRDPVLGEHVDAHQQRFVERMARSGHVVALATESELHAEVMRQVAKPRGAGVDASEDQGRVRSSVARFASLVDEVIAHS